jgi:hypothetical protein
VTHATWRAGLEAAHHLFTDAEMAYMNIATTIALIPACTDDVDWDVVCDVLFDPDRVVLPSTSAIDALGEEWDEVSADIEDLVDDLANRPSIFPAVWAEMMCRGWWGMPDYDEQVETLLARQVPAAWRGSGDELGLALRSTPLAVPIEVWEQIVGGNGFGWLDRFDR